MFSIKFGIFTQFYTFPIDYAQYYPTIMPKIMSAIADKMDEDEETKNTTTNEGSIAPHLNAISGWTDGLDLTPRAPCGARKTSLQLVSWNRIIFLIIIVWAKQINQLQWHSLQIGIKNTHKGMAPLLKFSIKSLEYLATKLVSWIGMILLIIIGPSKSTSMAFRWALKTLKKEWHPFIKLTSKYYGSRPTVADFWPPALFFQRVNSEH